MNDLIKKYLFLSFRRRALDYELNKYSKYFKGQVLDIGGARQRGLFKIDKKHLSKLVICDIDKNKKPDVIADVEKLPFKNSAFDAIRATELFEHVNQPFTGIKECIRVLKKSGVIILSTPFFYRIHADPEDYQRLTEYKIKKILKSLKCGIVVFKKQGFMFTVFADFLKGWMQTWPWILRYCGYIFVLPACELLAYLDQFNFVKKNNYLEKYPEGYFLVIKKY